MAWEKEEKIFGDYLSAKKLKTSEQRKEILRIFLNTDRHLTAGDLYRIVVEKYPNIGYATIYRTLKLMTESGLCRQLAFEDGTTRYEHLFGHKHHDHLICTACGQSVEVVEPQIERLQEKIMQAHGFFPLRHRMELYGLCRKCKK